MMLICSVKLAVNAVCCCFVCVSVCVCVWVGGGGGGLCVFVCVFDGRSEVNHT